MTLRLCDTQTAAYRDHGINHQQILMASCVYVLFIHLWKVAVLWSILYDSVCYYAMIIDRTKCAFAFGQAQMGFTCKRYIRHMVVVHSLEAAKPSVFLTTTEGLQ